MMKNIYLFLGLLLYYHCSSEDALFTPVDSHHSNVHFKNIVKDTRKMNILEYLYYYNGGGVSVGDINNDGLLDLFFVSNLAENKLYLNKGDLQFENISQQANISGNSDWNTGSTMVDINGDGFIDIYVCSVVGINGFEGHNELYINNGDLTFTESAATYGLDLDNYSSSATFFDYDLDGDLDMYLLNHAIHTPKSYGKASIRNKRSYESGDKLLRNDNGKFIDVSQQAGIFGGANSYGLSISVSDFNVDGYPDLYICNDFHEDDYYYLNNGNGTFSEQIKKHFGHTSRFSMGSDVGDINNDGFMDIISVDMLPNDEKNLKESTGDDKPNILNLRVKEYGYHYQYTRNMLQINQQGKSFSETALLSGVAATDWSWSPLFADFNQDGQQDLFVSNGIPHRPNNLDYIRYISNKEIQKKLNTTKLIDEEVIEKMPNGATHNYIFEGQKGIGFTDQSKQWIPSKPIISNGATYADLDNDGDLEIITNNLNEEASILENKTNTTPPNYLKISLKYKDKNPSGIGTKVYTYAMGKMQYRELFLTRGFQSSVAPIIHLGYDNTTVVDSILVVWPDYHYQKLTNIKTNQQLAISVQKELPKFDYHRRYHSDKNKLFTKVDDNLGVHFTHQENTFNDFDWKQNSPYKTTDKGPATAIGDINHDGKQDLYFGGSLMQLSQIYMQTDTGFKLTKKYALDSIPEVIDAQFIDCNNDGTDDLVIATGGQQHNMPLKLLKNAVYLNKNGTLQKKLLEGDPLNSSIIKPCDYDGDDDTDLFIGNYTDFNYFGEPYASHLLKNDKGNFSLVETPALDKLTLVTDALWIDIDGDGQKDLVVVGEWSTPRFFLNNQGKFNEITDIVLKNHNTMGGLWQCIAPFDIDQDGDIDLVLGNWGTNNKYNASEQYPMKMYIGAFGNQSPWETIITTEKNREYYPLNTLDELSSRLVFLKKKFNSYSSFANKNITQIFDKKQLDVMQEQRVHTLASGYLENIDGQYHFREFDERLQVAPIKCFVIYDFDNDQKDDLLLAGNYFGVTPFHGRFDGFSGALIKDKNHIVLGHQLGLDLMYKATKGLNILDFNDKKYLLITHNNDDAQIYKLDN